MNEIPKIPSYTILSIPASELTNQYRPMIFSKWLRSLRFGNKLFREVPSADFFLNYHKYIENLLAKPDSLVRMAVLSDDHDIALGFSVSREDVLDYVHVHYDYRKIGVGTKLLPQKEITTITHLTLIGIDIWNSKYKHWKFNPWA